MAEGLAIDRAEDTLYGKNRVGQELSGEVKQALEKREAIVAAIKEIQEIGGKRRLKREAFGKRRGKGRCEQFC
jgi:hypothetical protein